MIGLVTDTRTDGQTDGQMDESDFIGRCLVNDQRPIILKSKQTFYLT